MKRKNLLILLPVVLIPALALFFAGCGGDDDDNPMGAGDTTPPAAITDLAVDSISSNSVNLNWTVPTDPAKTTTTTQYDIRWSDANITSGNFGSAHHVDGELPVNDEETNQRVKLTGLSPETMYYFALKAGDAASNWSALSNVVSATTEPLSTDDVVEQVQETFSSLENLSTDCEALLLVDPTANADEFEFLATVLGSIIADTLGNVTLANYYGTWDDTGMPDDGEGVIKISSNPSDAFRILLVGTDTLGAAISGDLTISSLQSDLDVQDRTLTISASIAINQVGGESASLDFSVTVDLSALEGGGDLETLPEISMTLSGDICGLVIEMSMETTQDGQFSLSGYYEYDAERISFEMQTNIDDVDTCATFEVWQGTDQQSTDFYLTTTLCNTMMNCLNGSIILDGAQEVTFWAEDCTADTLGVSVEINGDTLSGEEVFDQLAVWFEEIWGLGSGGIMKMDAAHSPADARFHPIVNNPALILTREVFLPGR